MSKPENDRSGGHGTCLYVNRLCTCGSHASGHAAYTI